MDDLRRVVCDHQGNISKLGSFGDINERAKVGVIDSLYEPGNKFRELERVERTVDTLTGVSANDTNGHGWLVANIIRRYADNTEYYFYRVTAPNGDIWQRNLMKAMRFAQDDSVDILNISLGNDHTGDGNEGCNMHNQPCKIRQITKKLIDDGITIVAGAGNKPEFDSICCPALLDEAIAVGGYVSKCQARNRTNDPRDVIGRYEKPPNACYVERSDDLGISDVLCSGEGCSPIHSCDDNRKDVSWE